LPEAADAVPVRRASELEAATGLAYRQYLADMAPVRPGWL
jgi:hypothetical protein